MRFIAVCLLFLSTIQMHARQSITNPDRSDGFGAQFQTIIYSAIIAELYGMDFFYTPFNKMEHNYDNDPDFIAKKEWLINFKDNFELNHGNVSRPDMMSIIHIFEHNLQRAAKSEVLKKIKRIFRENKDRNKYFDDQHLHIVIHLRRPNPHDIRVDGTDTPDDVFLNIILKLRNLYSAQNPLFHIHSQGKWENYHQYQSPDVVLHLNESVEDSFTQMVLADILVTSISSYSYTAGILSDGIVYYMPFWHPQWPGWITVYELFR